MWQIAIGVGVLLLGGAVLSLLDDEVQSSHHAYSNARERLQQDTQRHQRNIQRALHREQEWHSYQAKIELHYAAVQTANLSHDLYRQAQQVRGSLLEQRKLSAQKIGQLKQQRDTAHPNARQPFRDALQRQHDLHAQIKQAVEAYSQQIDTQREELRQLNAHTAALKHDIRDNTGALGEAWFERLEQRKLQHRLG